MELRCPLCHAETKAEIERERSERKRLMDAVEIDSILGIRFGDKCNWATNAYASTEIYLERAFRGFEKVTVCTTVLGRVRSVHMERTIGVISEEDLLQEMDTLVEMIEKKYGIEFNECNSQECCFVNDNVIIKVAMWRSNIGYDGTIYISVWNKKVEKEDKEAFLKKRFHAIPKDEGFDLL